MTRRQYQIKASATAFRPHTIDWRVAPCTLPFKNVAADGILFGSTKVILIRRPSQYHKLLLSVVVYSWPPATMQPWQLLYAISCNISISLAKLPLSSNITDNACAKTATLSDASIKFKEASTANLVQLKQFLLSNQLITILFLKLCIAITSLQNVQHCIFKKL